MPFDLSVLFHWQSSSTARPFAMSSSSESKSSNSLTNSSGSNLSKPQSNAASTPPTSIATSGSPAKSMDSPILSADNPGLRVEWARAFNLGKWRQTGRGLRFAHEEVKDLANDATIYLNERMLELSRITRRAIAARLRYQRLRSRELDLIKSILDDETELCQTQLSGVDVQIGSIRNMLQDAGVAQIGSTGSRFDPNDAAGPCLIPICNRTPGNLLPVPVMLAQDLACNNPYLMDAPESLTFTPIEFDPDDPSESSLRQRGIPAQLGSSRYNPYARSMPGSRPSTSLVSASVIDDADSARCTTDLQEAPQSKCSIKDYDKTQQLAIEWAKMRLVMDGATTGWIRNSTRDEKVKMEMRVREIIFHAGIKFGCVRALTKDRRELAKTGEEFAPLYKLEPPSKRSEEECQIYMNNRRVAIYDANQPFKYYLHGIEETETSTNVLVFSGQAVESTHIKHWYESKKSPLYDEEMRSSINTTPLDMLAESAVGIRCAIDRYVEGRLSGSKENNTLHFATDVYANEQQLIKNAMVFALQQNIHRESFQKRLLYLHHRGLQKLHEKLGLSAPEFPIHVPLTAEELSKPRLVPSHNTATALPGPSTLLPFGQIGGQAPLMTSGPQMSFVQISGDVGLNMWGFPSFGDSEQSRLE
ncbi:hypothetical protein EV424DRAFT_1347156 [Suillus variegatus]|nr:hypothetical protein EV424DRAFT_1347156 [Suillus variegatus]